MAGMVASLWQGFPQLTNAQVVQVIKESSSFYANPTDEMGYGIPNFFDAMELAVLSVDNAAAAKFVVFPNPALNFVSVSVPESISEAQLTFFNTLGQIVARQKVDAQQHTVNIENLANGLYLYKITSGNSTQTGKLIKG